MKILGLEISLSRKAAVVASPVYNASLYDRGWFPVVVQEPFAGAWQRNMPMVMGNALQNATLYRCVSMIAADIAKMRLKLLEQVGRVWQETTVAGIQPGDDQAEQLPDAHSVLRDVAHQQAAHRQYLCAEGTRRAQRGRFHVRPQPAPG